MTDETANLILEQLRAITEISDMHADMRTLGKRVGKLETYVRAIQIDVAQIRADLQDHESRVTVLESKD